MMRIVQVGAVGTPASVAPRGYGFGDDNRVRVEGALALAIAPTEDVLLLIEGTYDELKAFVAQLDDHLDRRQMHDPSVTG